MKNFTGTPSFFPLVQGKNLQEPLHFPKGKTRTFHPNPSGRSEDWEKSFKGALKGCWHGGVPHKFWMVYVMENPMIRWKSDDSSGMGDWGGPPFFVKPPDDWTCFHIHSHPFTSIYIPAMNEMKHAWATILYNHEELSTSMRFGTAQRERYGWFSGSTFQFRVLCAVMAGGRKHLLFSTCWLS